MLKVIRDFAVCTRIEGVSEDLTDTVLGLRNGPYKAKRGAGEMSFHFITPLNKFEVLWGKCWGRVSDGAPF
jgi:hypothetical protein